MTSRRRVCVNCGSPVRAHHARWVHDERHQGTVAARQRDADHRAVATWAAPPPADPPTAVEVRPRRQPRRPIAPIPQPVQWGPPMPFTRHPFDPDETRLRGCAAAAGVDTIGEL